MGGYHTVKYDEKNQFGVICKIRDISEYWMYVIHGTMIDCKEIIIHGIDIYK